MDILSYAAIPLQYLGIATNTRNAVVEKPREYVVLPNSNPNANDTPVTQLTYKKDILEEVRRRGGTWLYTKSEFAQYRTVQMDKRFVDPVTERLYSYLLNDQGLNEQKLRLFYRELEGLDPEDRSYVHEERGIIKHASNYHRLSRLSFKHKTKIEGDKILYIDFPHFAIPATQQQLAKSVSLEALLQEPAPGVRILNRDMFSRQVEHIELYNRHGVLEDRIQVQELPMWKRTIYAPKGGYLKVVPAQQDQVLQYHTNGTAELQKGAGSLYSEFLIFSHQYQGIPVKNPSPVAAVLKDFSDAASKVASSLAAFFELEPLPTQTEIASRLIEKNIAERRYTDRTSLSTAEKDSETHLHVNVISLAEGVSQEAVSRAGAAS